MEQAKTSDKDQELFTSCAFKLVCANHAQTSEYEGKTCLQYYGDTDSDVLR